MVEIVSRAWASIVLLKRLKKIIDDAAPNDSSRTSFKVYRNIVCQFAEQCIQCNREKLHHAVRQTQNTLYKQDLIRRKNMKGFKPCQSAELKGDLP